MSEPTIVEKLIQAEKVVADLTAKLDAATANAKAAEDLANAAQATITAKESELAKLASEKAAIESENAKAESDAKAAAEQVAAKDAELTKLKNAVASNPAFADASAGREPIASPNNAKLATLSAEEFRKLTPMQQRNFSVAGGKIS